MQRVIVTPRSHFNELLLGVRERFPFSKGNAEIGVFVAEVKEVTTLGVTIRPEHHNGAEVEVAVLFDKTEESGVYKFQGEEYIFLDVAVL